MTTDYRHPRSGRNRIDVLEDDGGHRIVRKRAAGAGPYREAWFYRWVAPSMTSVLHPETVDDRLGVVDLPLVENAASITDRYTDPIRRVHALASLAGFLRSLHGLDLSVAPPAELLPSLMAPPAAIVIDGGPAVRALLEKIQSDDDLRAADEVVQATGGPIRLIHGDLKPDNVLIKNGRPVVIDWDTCGRGPIWRDLGALVGSMYDEWALSITGDDASQIQAGFSIDVVHQAVAWSLGGYLGRDHISGEAIRLVRCHAIHWLAWRVLTRAGFASEPSPHDASVLGLACWLARGEARAAA